MIDMNEKNTPLSLLEHILLIMYIMFRHNFTVKRSIFKLGHFTIKPSAVLIDGLYCIFTFSPFYHQNAIVANGLTLHLVRFTIKTPWEQMAYTLR